MEKVVLTGASGFIGKHTIPYLKSQGFDIHALIVSEKTDDLDKDITWHTIDIFDFKKISEFCREIKASNLLHLAWLGGDKDRMTSSININWVEASLHLVRQFAENDGKRIVMAGSCNEYDWQYGYCSEKITPNNPESLYGECKSSVNRIVEKYAQKNGISYSSGRIFFVYGPHEQEKRLVAYAIRSLLKKQKAALSHGNQIRDYLHVDDVADALVKLLVSDVTGTVNIGSGCAVKLREIVDLIGEKLDGKELLDYGPVESKFDSPVVLADITRLRNELGWKPKYDLDQGLEDTIEWWKNELQNKKTHSL